MDTDRRTLPLSPSLRLTIGLVIVLALMSVGRGPGAQEKDFVRFAEEVERVIKRTLPVEEPVGEERPGPQIQLRKEGHADVRAKRRAISWEIADASGLAFVEVRLARVEPVSMKPAELYASTESRGTVDLQRLGKGPGLYALLVMAENNEGERGAAAVRFAYTMFREDCPSAKVWWPADQ